MKVPVQFKEDFNKVMAHYGVTPEERKEAVACITPATLDDAVMCFRSLAEEVDAQERAGIHSSAR